MSMHVSAILFLPIYIYIYDHLITIRWLLLPARLVPPYSTWDRLVVLMLLSGFLDPAVWLLASVRLILSLCPPLLATRRFDAWICFFSRLPPLYPVGIDADADFEMQLAFTIRLSTGWL